MGQPVTSTHGAASHSTFYPLLCKHTFLASCKVCTYINQFKAFTAFKTMTNSIKFTTGAFLFVSQFKSDKAELNVSSPLKWTDCELILKWTDCELLWSELIEERRPQINSVVARLKPQGNYWPAFGLIITNPLSDFHLLNILLDCCSSSIVPIDD